MEDAQLHEADAEEGVAGRTMAEITARGLLDTFLAQPEERQRQYAEVSLKDLAAYVRWRRGAQAEQWQHLDGDGKAGYVPEDPRGFLAADGCGVWESLLADGAPPCGPGGNRAAPAEVEAETDAAAMPETPIPVSAGTAAAETDAAMPGTPIEDVLIPDVAETAVEEMDVAAGGEAQAQGPGGGAEMAERKAERRLPKRPSAGNAAAGGEVQAQGPSGGAEMVGRKAKRRAPKGPSAGMWRCRAQTAERRAVDAECRAAAAEVRAADAERRAAEAEAALHERHHPLKQPANAYQLWLKDFRLTDEYRAMGAGIETGGAQRVRELAQLLGPKWRALPQETREHYARAAKQESKAFQEAKKARRA